VNDQQQNLGMGGKGKKKKKNTFRGYEQPKKKGSQFRVTAPKAKLKYEKGFLQRDRDRARNPKMTLRVNTRTRNRKRREKGKGHEWGDTKTGFKNSTPLTSKRSRNLRVSKPRMHAGFYQRIKSR